jgi:hypothetical protein
MFMASYNHDNPWEILHLDILISRSVRKFPLSFPQTQSIPMLSGSLSNNFFSRCVHITLLTLVILAVIFVSCVKTAHSVFCYILTSKRINLSQFEVTFLFRGNLGHDSSGPHILGSASWKHTQLPTYKSQH